jgi:hypothetical protein
MIRASWDEAARRLTLHDRQRCYPGMPGSREFRIVIGDGPYDHLSSEASEASRPAPFFTKDGRSRLTFDLGSKTRLENNQSW